MFEPSAVGSWGAWTSLVPTRRPRSALTTGPPSPGNAGDLGGAAASVLLRVPPGRVHSHAGQQVRGGRPGGQTLPGCGQVGRHPTLRPLHGAHCPFPTALRGSCCTPSASTWTSSRPVSASGPQDPKLASSSTWEGGQGPRVLVPQSGAWWGGGEGGWSGDATNSRVAVGHCLEFTRSSLCI